MTQKHQFGWRSGLGDYTDTEFSNEAEIFGKASFFDSLILGGSFHGEVRVIKSQVGDRPVIAGKSIIYESMVSGHSQIVEEAVVSYSDIAGLSVVTDKGMVISSKMDGFSRVSDTALIQNVHMSDYSSVCGTGMVIGDEDSPVILSGYALIDRGVWSRAPMHYVAKGGWLVCENVDDLVTVSCTTNTVTKWLSGAGRRYGRMVGMSTEEIDEVQHYVELIKAHKENTGEKA